MPHADATHTVGFVLGTVIGLAVGVGLIVIGVVRLRGGADGPAKAAWILAIVFGALIVLGGIGSFATHS